MKDKQEDTGMRKEKSFIVLILVTCLVLSLTACGNKSATKESIFGYENSRCKCIGCRCLYSF